MASDWPRLNYEDWSETCDTLHAYTQVLGKLAVALAPPEPELQHAALCLSARGWETEVPWSVPLDADEVHTTYVPEQVSTYFSAATQAALVLAALRAPYRGRSTPVNSWWGSFDLAVNLFSGAPAASPRMTSSRATPWTCSRSRSGGGRVISAMARPDPHAAAITFARSAVRHACVVASGIPR
jgi:hypothetical protein